MPRQHLMKLWRGIESLGPTRGDRRDGGIEFGTPAIVAHVVVRAVSFTCLTEPAMIVAAFPDFHFTGSRSGWAISVMSGLLRVSAEFAFLLASRAVSLMFAAMPFAIDTLGHPATSFK